jgi:hypothetical protein
MIKSHNIIKNNLTLCSCGQCNELILKYDNKNKERRFKHNHHQKGFLNNKWKGGEEITTDGYVQIIDHNHPQSDKRGRIKKHRVIYEKYYNCCLLSWTVIHHKDGNKLNNDPLNLEATNPSKHATITFTKDLSERDCKICYSNITQVKNNKYYEWYHYQDGFICQFCYNVRRSIEKDLNALMVPIP